MRRILTITLVVVATSVFAQDIDVNISETFSETHTISDSLTTGGESHYIMSGYSGPIGCPWPMEEAQFAEAKNLVRSKSFDDEKLTTAKQITGSNCLKVSQVLDLMKEMDFEDSKLVYAKFAYNQTFDPGNYSKLNDAFDFDSSIDELSEYIKNVK